MADDVPDLRKAGGQFWLPLIMGALWSLAGLIWVAAKYPDRSEFNGAIKELHQLQLDLVKAGSNSESSRAGVERLEGAVRRLEDQITSIAQARRGR